MSTALMLSDQEFAAATTLIESVKARSEPDIIEALETAAIESGGTIRHADNLNPCAELTLHGITARAASLIEAWHIWRKSHEARVRAFAT